jgi:hypothetical protein
VASKPMLGALLTSIAYERCDSSEHVRTYVRTNEELLTFSSYLTVGNARGGAANA